MIRSSIFGTIALPMNRDRVLVVAETGGIGYACIASSNGEFRISNLPAGSYSITAYARGVNYESAQADIPADGDVKVTLSLTGAAGRVRL